MTRGFVLGKFMPPHAGHVLLCETASALVDQLTILVAWLPDDPIPGEVRLAWMRQLFPDAEVIGHGAVAPQSPEEHPNFWPIWKGIVKSVHPDPIDYVFASEDYGERLAQELGARFIPVDPGREAMPISASMIRDEPWAHWRHIPAPVRPYYAGRIALHGPESTGKSTLAFRLARHFDTLVMPEYGRIWCERYGTELTMDDLLTIAKTHDIMTRSLLAKCNCRLIIDTDPLMTAAWAEMLLGKSDPWFDEWREPADLYLLLDTDLPWKDDGTRLFGEAKARQRFMDISRDQLERRGLRYAVIGGEGEARFENALAAIDTAGLGKIC